MDLSPDKRFDHRVKKNVKDNLEKKDEARNLKKSFESKVQEVTGKPNQPMGLFSGGRMSNLSFTITKEDQDVARKRGDLLQLLSSQSPPSIETLLRSLETETDHQRKK